MPSLDGCPKSLGAIKGANLGYEFIPHIFPMNNGELLGATNRVSEPSTCSLVVSKSLAMSIFWEYEMVKNFPLQKFHVAFEHGH